MAYAAAPKRPRRRPLDPSLQPSWVGRAVTVVGAPSSTGARMEEITLVIAPAARWGGRPPEECRDGEADPLRNAGMGST
jgi:hypothetical protein